MDPVTVQFFKYPRSLHWGMETLWLGEDRWGVWLAAPKGARRWLGEAERSVTSEKRVLCVPHAGWWVLSHNGPGPSLSHFIDIATSARWGTGRVEMIDLDLDVVVHQDGTVAIDDEDEFLSHQVQLGYPQELIEKARRMADQVFAAVSRRDEPFFDVAGEWLTRF